MVDHERLAGDEPLLGALREAMDAATQVPPRFLQAGKEIFAWHTVDAELADLAYDSAAEPASALAGARSEAPALRALTFEAGGVAIELEVTAEGVQGHVVPVRKGEIEMQRRDGSRETTQVDEVGWFMFTGRPPGMFRLALRSPGMATTLTTWIAL